MAVRSFARRAERPVVNFQSHRFQVKKIVDIHLKRILTHLPGPTIVNVSNSVKSIFQAAKSVRLAQLALDFVLLLLQAVESLAERAGLWCSSRFYCITPAGCKHSKIKVIHLCHLQHCYSISSHRRIVHFEPCTTAKEQTMNLATVGDRSRPMKYRIDGSTHDFLLGCWKSTSCTMGLGVHRIA